MHGFVSDPRCYVNNRFQELAESLLLSNGEMEEIEKRSNYLASRDFIESRINNYEMVRRLGDLVLFGSGRSFLIKMMSEVASAENESPDDNAFNQGMKQGYGIPSEPKAAEYAGEFENGVLLGKWIKDAAREECDSRDRGVLLPVRNMDKLDFARYRKCSSDEPVIKSLYAVICLLEHIDDADKMTNAQRSAIRDLLNNVEYLGDLKEHDRCGSADSLEVDGWHLCRHILKMFHQRESEGDDWLMLMKLAMEFLFWNGSEYPHSEEDDIDEILWGKDDMLWCCSICRFEFASLDCQIAFNALYRGCTDAEITDDEKETPGVLNFYQLGKFFQPRIRNRPTETEDESADDDEVRGCVYALLNEKMADIVKIGFSGTGKKHDSTVEAAAARIRSLSRSTSAPVPFLPLIVVEVDDCKHVEEMLHMAFDRVNERREFFKCEGINTSIDAEGEFKKKFMLYCKQGNPVDITDAVLAMLNAPTPSLIHRAQAQIDKQWKAMKNVFG